MYKPIHVFYCVSGVDVLDEMFRGTVGRFTRVVFNEEYKLSEKVGKKQFGVLDGGNQLGEISGRRVIDVHK